MSLKSKNLAYESNEPAFLRKLKGQLGGANTASSERSSVIAKRLQKSVEDDDPTYVLSESNDTISKDEYEKLVAGKIGTHSKEPSEELAPGPEDTKQSKPPITEVGQASKKRKTAKVIGNDADENLDQLPTQEKLSASIPKSKKKKKIKLSFDQVE